MLQQSRHVRKKSMRDKNLILRADVCLLVNDCAADHVLRSKSATTAAPNGMDSNLSMPTFGMVEHSKV
jgi:hypothetical protein